MSEQARHRMIAALEEQFGTEVAMTMAEHLPPTGWAEVATRRDLELLETRIGARFDQMDARFTTHEARFDRMDARFQTVDARFDAMEAKTDARFDAVDARFDAVDDRLDGFERRFRAELLGELDRRFAAQTRTMMVGFISTFIGLGGLIIGTANLLA